MDRIAELPKDEEQLSKAVNAHFERCYVEAMPYFTRMRVAEAYLAGARIFKVINATTGEVKAFYPEDDFKAFKSADLIRLIDRVTGHLNSYDMTCKINRVGTSLTAVREAAAGQILVDAALAPDAVSEAQRIFNWTFASKGSCGITAKVKDSASMLGLETELQIIPPYELVPYPAIREDLTKLAGIGRQSYVSVSSLRKKLGTAKLKAAFEKRLYWFKAQPGTNIQMESIVGDLAGSYGLYGMYGNEPHTNTAVGSMENREENGYVRIRELWIKAPGGLCTRKVTVSGNAVLEDINYEEKGIEAYVPIGFARFIENGTFYGAGMYDLLFSTVREIEKMHDVLFKNVADDASCGYILLPQGSSNMELVAKPVDKGLKIISYEPDPYGTSGHRPIEVRPVSTSDKATNTTAYAMGYLNTLNPLQDLVAEKGRIDSQTGLAFLQEYINKAMTNQTSGLVQAFSTMYRSVLGQTIQRLVSNNRAIPVTRVSLDLAGAIVDWRDGTVQFKVVPIGSLRGVKCEPRLTEFRSMQQRKAEAQEWLKLAMVTPMQVLIKSIIEGWDLPVWMDSEQSAVQSCIQDILTLYGDGETPGAVEVNPNFNRPEIQLPIIDAFMASEKMRVASIDVQNSFISWREQLQTFIGRTLPAGLDRNIEEL